MKHAQYTEKDDDFNIYDELNSKSYLTITTSIAKEVSEKKDEISAVSLKFEDKKREIAIAKKEIARLKKKLRILNKEKREIGKDLSKKQRSMNIDINFLNAVNTAMQSNNGHYLVDYQKRKVL